MDILVIVVGLMGLMNLVMVVMLWVKVYSGSMDIREEGERMKREMKELVGGFNREADRNILLLEDGLRNGRELLKDMDKVLGRVVGRGVLEGLGGMKSGGMKSGGMKGVGGINGVRDKEVKSGVQKAYELVSEGEVGGVKEVGMKKVGMKKVGMKEVGMKEVGMKEVGMKEVGMKEVGMKKVGMKEVGMKKVGMKEVGMKKVGMKKVGMKKVGMKKVGMKKVGMKKGNGLEGKKKESERIHGVARLIGEGKGEEEIVRIMGMSLAEVELCKVILSNEVLGGMSGMSGRKGLIKRIIGQ